MRIQPVLTFALLTALPLAACDTSRSVTEEAAGSSSGSCVGCHGGADNDTGAPPTDAHGRSEGPEVGAHTAHLDAGVACESCHRVPATVNDPGHIGGEKVVFGAAARQDGATPAFVPSSDPASPLGGTCSSTYCHGATLDAGGRQHAPAWNGPSAACGDCHGVPPPSHGALVNCAQCHSESVNPDLTFKPGKHVDGTVQVDLGVACTGCHGDASRVTALPLDRAAPPVDASGQTASAKVGAHQAHLADGPLAKAVACTECHVVPYGTAHATEPNPVVVFDGPVGTAGGAAPVYTSGTCSGVYCHGGFRNGNSGNAPAWTATGTQSACDSCHAPQAGDGDAGYTDRHQDHLSRGLTCSVCHLDGYASGSAPRVNAATHVNGTVNTNATIGWDAAAHTCTTSCHGTPRAWY